MPLLPQTLGLKSCKWGTPRHLDAGQAWPLLCVCRSRGSHATHAFITPGECHMVEAPTQQHRACPREAQQPIAWSSPARGFDNNSALMCDRTHSAKNKAPRTRLAGQEPNASPPHAQHQPTTNRQPAHSKRATWNMLSHPATPATTSRRHNSNTGVTLLTGFNNVLTAVLPPVPAAAVPPLPAAHHSANTGRGVHNGSSLQQHGRDPQVHTSPDCYISTAVPASRPYTSMVTGRLSS
jgi:hypothetical protein